MTETSLKLMALGDLGKPVDWWFMYKVAGRSEVSNGSKATGTEYVYYDSEFPKGKKLQLSNFNVSNSKEGALSNTLNQIYNNSDNPDMGWYFYNDENPVTDKTNSSRGHTKGVVAFNLETDSGFWLVHSTPKFAPENSYSYPETGMENAQTLLCISLKNADEAKKIAEQMHVGQEPNVYLSSDVPKLLKDKPDDPRVLLINDKIRYGDIPYADSIIIESLAGKKFMVIAKNKHWNTKGDDDFYNDLVAVKLNENLEVETWEHGKTPGATDNDSHHSVTAMKCVDLSPLGCDPSYTWSEENDHAKLAISGDSEKVKYVCVGDINFTIAQEKRSGGTVAFVCPDLWASLNDILKEKQPTKSRREEMVG